MTWVLPAAALIWGTMEERSVEAPDRFDVRGTQPAIKGLARLPKRKTRMGSGKPKKASATASVPVPAAKAPRGEVVLVTLSHLVPASILGILALLWWTGSLKGGPVVVGAPFAFFVGVLAAGGFVSGLSFGVLQARRFRHAEWVIKNIQPKEKILIREKVYPWQLMPIYWIADSEAKAQMKSGSEFQFHVWEDMTPFAFLRRLRQPAAGEALQVPVSVYLEPSTARPVAFLQDGKVQWIGAEVPKSMKMLRDISDKQSGSKSQ